MKPNKTIIMKMRKSHINLIRSVAWSYHRSTGIEWGELFSEASLGYCEGMIRYHPSKGRLSTYMYMYMNNRLKNYLKKAKKYAHLSLDEVKVERSYTPKQFFEFRDSLSKTAKVIADMVAENPNHYILCNSREARRRLREDLRDRDWTYNQIYKGFNELKSVVDEIE